MPDLLFILVPAVLIAVGAEAFFERFLSRQARRDVEQRAEERGRV